MPTIRDTFPGYYRPTDEEFKQLWDESFFVFDANVLLNIYRYTPETREVLFRVLERLQSRIWVPHQAALEFHRRRLDVIDEQLAAYDEVAAALDEAAKRVETVLSSYGRRHPFIKSDEIRAAAEKHLAELRESVLGAKALHPDLRLDDGLRDRLGAIIGENVGSPYSEDQLAMMYKDGDRRYASKQPPGYKDAAKPAPDKYGDYVIWRQLVDHAKTERKPAIFVTDDRKEDWWWARSGETVGPRPELVQEMRSEAGVGLYLYRPEQFLDRAQQSLGLEATPRAVQEAREIGEQAGATQDPLTALAAALGASREMTEAALLSDILTLAADLSIDPKRLPPFFGYLVQKERDRLFSEARELSRTQAYRQRVVPIRASLAYLEPPFDTSIPPAVIRQENRPEDAGDSPAPVYVPPANLSCP